MIQFHNNFSIGFWSSVIVSASAVHFNSAFRAYILIGNAPQLFRWSEWFRSFWLAIDLNGHIYTLRTVLFSILFRFSSICLSLVPNRIRRFVQQTNLIIAKTTRKLIGRWENEKTQTHTHTGLEMSHQNGLYCPVIVINLYRTHPLINRIESKRERGKNHSQIGLSSQWACMQTHMRTRTFDDWGSKFFRKYFEEEEEEAFDGRANKIAQFERDWKCFPRCKECRQTHRNKEKKEKNNGKNENTPQLTGNWN